MTVAVAAHSRKHPRLVVVERVQDDPDYLSTAQSYAVRDEIRSRIANDRLRGIRVDHIGPVVTDGNGSTMYAVEADIDDYISRGNTLPAPCPQRAGCAWRSITRG